MKTVTKTYFTVDDDDRSRVPMWVWNSKLVDSEWKRYMVKVAHPLEVPADLRGYGIVLQRIGPAENIVKGALQSGIFLSKAQLQKLQTEYKFELPGKGCGSGKGGNLVKLDYADRLLTYMFGAELPQLERKRMLSFLLGKAWNRLGKGAKHAQEILQAFKSLDPQDQPTFTELAAVAADEEKLTNVRSKRVDIKAVHASPAHLTSKELAGLLPQGKGFTCRFNRHPVEQRYQVFVFHAATGISAGFIKLLPASS